MKSWSADLEPIDQGDKQERESPDDEQLPWPATIDHWIALTSRPLLDVSVPINCLDDSLHHVHGKGWESPYRQHPFNIHTARCGMRLEAKRFVDTAMFYLTHQGYVSPFGKHICKG